MSENSSKIANFQNRISRRSLLKKTFDIICVGALSGGYARYIEPKRIAIRNEVIKIPNLKYSFKILHISDLHYSDKESLSVINKAILLGLEQNPDLILLTGDFITSGIEDSQEYITVLKQLSEKIPVYACLGNHDGGNWSHNTGGLSSTKEVESVLEKSKIKVLKNQSELITIKNSKINLVGVGDLWANQLDPEKSFDKIDNNHPTIVMCHNPDGKDKLQDKIWDLMLSGHTHGGQIGIPFLTEFVAPVKDKRFIAGLYNWEGKQIYISKGVGSLMGMRFNCLPEISCLELISTHN